MSDMLIRAGLWTVAYLVVGLLIFAACARWSPLDEGDAPDALRDIALLWAPLLIATPILLLHERYDLSWEHLARWFYRAVRSSSEDKTP